MMRKDLQDVKAAVLSQGIHIEYIMKAVDEIKGGVQTNEEDIKRLDRWKNMGAGIIGLIVFIVPVIVLLV